MEITIPHAMQACAQHGNEKIMELLLSINGADPSINNSSVLVIACKHRHIGIVRLLLADNRVDASTADLLPIRVAASAGASDIVALLLANHHIKRMVQSDAQVIKSALIFGRTKVRLRIFIAISPWESVVLLDVSYSTMSMSWALILTCCRWWRNCCGTEPQFPNPMLLVSNGCNM